MSQWQSNCTRPRRSFVVLAILFFAAGPAAAAAPDLLITDFWEQNHQVQFRIRNAGDATCGTGHVAALFANGKIQDTVAINSKLLPGTSMVGTFPKFYWQCSQDGQHALEVVADYHSAIQESNEKNNTRQETWICDLTPPKITSGPSATDITVSSARIVWTTNESCDSVVRYGVKPGTYPTQVSSSVMTANHQVLLKNLDADRTYYYIVESTDAGGNTVQSQQHSFKTDPDEWPDLLVEDFEETNGTITARIKNAGDATAGAGHSAALYVDNQFVDSAYIPVSLAPGAHYDATFQQYTWECTQPQRVLLVVADLQNVVDESDEDNNSRQETWTCDLTAPLILTGPDVEDITTTSATVLWTTDEDSDSVVWYGTKHNSYSVREFDATLTKSHSIALSALEPDTLYYYFVESTDDSGNSTQSGEHTFQTWSAQADRPDLAVTKLWRMDHAVHYRVTNFGSAAAPSGHLAALYMDGDRYDTDRVTLALGPGESVEGRFPKFYFQCMDAEHELKVAADDENVVDESDETNNVRAETVACDVKLEIVSGPEVQDVTPTAATIVWSTNKAADGTVEYDTHAQEFSLSEDDPKLVESHEIRLTKLLPGRLYQYRVVSRNPNDEKAASDAAYFKTPSAGANLPPLVKSLTITREPTKVLYYMMAADVEDDTGVAYVSFFLDGELIHTDYSEPYECPVVAAALAMSRAQFFEEHTIAAVAVDDAMLSADRLGFFDPEYECAEVTAEFREPHPGDVLYIEGDTVPADTTVPITVFAAEWDWNCWVSNAGNHRGEHPIFCLHGYAPVDEVRFYANMAHIDTVPTSPIAAFTHIYRVDWPVGGYRTGDYRVRVDAVADDECIQTITRDFRIETGAPRLELERFVTRHGNYFHVELYLRNRGTVPFRCDRIVDNVDGLQPVYKFEPSCEVTPLADTVNSRHYEVDINLHSGTGILYVEIPAYGRLTVDYLAVPAQLMAPGATGHAIGADAVRVVDYFSSDDWEFDRPCVLTEDDELFDVAMDTAIAGSDYLIVTNPARLVAEFGSSRDTLCSMAELAIERNGILGYISGPDWDDPLSVRDTAISPWGATMNGGAYLSNGYLLLVGETEIVPAWTVPIPDRNWSSGERTVEVGLSDLAYGDMSGSDNAPELAVGRIIGNSAGDLIGAMEASINSSFDRSYGLVTTGYDKAGDDFVTAGWNISDVLTDQEDAGLCMADGHRLHHWSAHVQKEQLVSGYDFPMDSGDGFLMANLYGTRFEAVRFDRYQARMAMHSTLDLIDTHFYSEFYCDFAPGDALACGDIDNDGADEIVIGRIGDDLIAIEHDLGHGDLEFPVELDSWDVVACGDLRDDAREEIVVARRTGDGTIRIYSYDNSGTPTLSLVRTLSIPFTAWDGFAIGDVDTSTAGNEIIVGRDDDDRIYIYDSAGGAIADIPCDPYTAYDAMVVGDFDGEGNDEIAVVIDDDVHGKRTLKIFQNDCWEVDPAGGWKLKRGRHSTVYSRFLHFDGIRTTGGDSGGDGLDAADIDGDGKDELCLARAGDDRLYILDAEYSQGWKDRYMPIVQAEDDSLDLIVMAGHGSPGSLAPFGTADIATFGFSAGPVAYGLS
ncbi:MAG: fibronectin type III domain-containing protein, partial [Sedimentisphaerales bacterium]|nr:fibronectin type III domain-containing protein [Sedimentisphaerales bacterium]